MTIRSGCPLFKSFDSAFSMRFDSAMHVKQALVGLAFSLGLSFGHFVAAAPAQDLDHTHATYAELLQQVVHDGRVDYRALHQNPEALNRYLDELAGVSERTFDGWDIPHRLSYLINLHNATVLKMVADRYPVRSFKRVAGWFGDPFTKPVVRLFGNRITLNILRDNIMRRHYAEPAIHFGLVPAARGAPPLRAEPYVPDRLYEQLDDQLERFLADEHNNRVDRANGRLQLSPIFRWYKADFDLRAGSVAVYLRPHVNADGRAGDFSIRYGSYDWALNDLHPRK